jgi:ClpP class serine protease
VLSYTGVQVELSVLMVDSPGGEHFGAEDLARLAHKAPDQQAL